MLPDFSVTDPQASATGFSFAFLQCSMLMAASQSLYQLPMVVQQATPKTDLNQKQSLFSSCRSAIWIELTEWDSSGWHVVLERGLQMAGG